MGAVLALMVFVFPLALPLLTAGTYIAVLMYTRGSPANTFGLGLAVTPILVIVLGPGLQRGGAGAFVLPWWLLLSGPADYYVWHYLFVCAILVALSCLGGLIYVQIATRSAAREMPKATVRPPASPDAIVRAIQEHKTGLPITQHCAACGGLLSITAQRKPHSHESTLRVSCSCGGCNGNIAA